MGLVNFFIFRKMDNFHKLNEDQHFEERKLFQMILVAVSNMNNEELTGSIICLNFFNLSCFKLRCGIYPWFER